MLSDSAHQLQGAKGIMSVAAIASEYSAALVQHDLPDFLRIFSVVLFRTAGIDQEDLFAPRQILPDKI